MTKKNKTIVRLVALAVLAALGVWVVADNANAPYRKTEGKIFGTFYHITYRSSAILDTEVLDCLEKVDASMSAFNGNSIVSRVNRNERVAPDAMFRHVFAVAREVSETTNGSFDITVAPLVNLWGFGFKNSDSVTRSMIDSIMPFVGYRGVSIEGNRVVKQHPETMLDFSAIAKGYGCDVVAEMFERHGVEDYMIEIGGEIRARGLNSRQQQWTLGIEKPIDDSLSQHHELLAVLQKDRMAVATSGNYRNFYYKDGHKYAHTISPFTGCPVEHSLLSATVSAPTCAMADAYATAFMVMGTQKAIAFLSKRTDIEAFLVYADSLGNYCTWHSESLSKYIEK
ncbi:MAG: FAD:protein FMN transferase [Prevotellaceae bacterium]|nr:FAD:protein FMN transferase [Prevotellaceae bacterium]